MNTLEAARVPSAGDCSTEPVALRLMPTKIQAMHRDRLALVYVRQSTPQQVLENRESTARQYALAGLATAWGWLAPRVLVIDEDQGQSGRSADHRSGFQRLLAEVTMDHVGLILGLEMSRLARSNKDWHHLLELCALFSTLLADQDGVYDPSDPNDRLLLGLKGTMSEVELHTMRNRLDRGRLHKAQRGELFHTVPFGYVKLPHSAVDKDPDAQARSVVELILSRSSRRSARCMGCSTTWWSTVSSCPCASTGSWTGGGHRCRRCRRPSAIRSMPAPMRMAVAR
jgi:DNA invertase Pin-like site-specific DNA recombinase